MTEPAKLKVEDIEHSPLGASGASRWMNCPGSIRLASLLPADSDDAGFPAAEGTAAHQVLEMSIRADAEPWEFAGTVIEVDQWEFTVGPEMVASVTNALDYVHTTIGSIPRSRIEAEVQMTSETHRLARGTSDVVVVPQDPEFGAAHVFDLKYGQGIVVEPSAVQMRYYGYLVSEKYNLPDEKMMVLHIMQPRIPHPKGLNRPYTTTAGELRKWWNDEVLPAMAETEKEDALLKTGNHCRFCPAKTICPALREETESVDVGRPAGTLTGDELGDLLQRVDRIKRYGEALKKEALSRVVAGERVKGKKLVRKKANRTWRKGVDEALVARFGDEAYNRSLKTPPQVETLGGGNAFVSEWAYKPDTGVTLANDDDPKEEVQSAMDQYMASGAPV